MVLEGLQEGRQRLVDHIGGVAQATGSLVGDGLCRRRQHSRNDGMHLVGLRLNGVELMEDGALQSSLVMVEVIGK